MRTNDNVSRIISGLYLCAMMILAPTGARGQITVKGYTPRPDVSRQAGVERPRPRSGKAIDLDLNEAPEIRLGPLSPAERRVPLGNRFEKRARIGAVRSAPPSAMGKMRLTRVANGTIGLLRVVSPGARGLRLRLRNLALPPGATIFVISANDPNEFYGPFEDRGPSGDGEVWTPDVLGEAAVIEYFVPDLEGEAGPIPFAITEVAHIFDDSYRATTQQQPGPCHNNVPAEWAEAAKSVGRVQAVTTKGVFACSGVLINTAANSGIPYFLTANHCVSTQIEATQMLVRWLNDGGASTSGPTSYGAALLSTGQASDYSLVRFNSVPSGVRFSGWTTLAPAAGTSVASIHHPFDSFQRYSRGRLTTESCPGFIENGFCANFLPVRWESGITEPGSSGGPLWVGSPADPLLAGLLSGGISSCANPQGADYFNRFAVAFQAFAPYLTGEGCIWQLSESEKIVKASGDSLSFDLRASSANQNCPWTASSNVAWISIVSAASGSSEATVSYTVAPNPGTDPRTGAIYIAGQQYVLTQLGNPAPSCQPIPLTLPDTTVPRTLSAASCRSIVNRDAFAARFTFQGLAGQQLFPSVNSPDFDTMLLILKPDGSILGFNDDLSGTASAVFGGPTAQDPVVLPAAGTYTVEVTSFEAGETGTFYLNLLKSCLLKLPIRNFIVPPEGAALEIEVLAPPDCSFAADSAIPWIKIASGANYAGTQKVKVTVEPATEYAVASWAGKRSAVFKIAGQDVEIIQQLKCGKFTLLKSSITVGPGTWHKGELGFSTGLHCDWTLTSDVPWIKFDGPTSGKGYIQTSYRVDSANLGGSPRVGRIIAGDQAFTITQLGIGENCSPTPVAIGQTVTGTLSPQCRSVGVAPEHAVPASYFKFSGTAGQRVAIAAFRIDDIFRGVELNSTALLPPSFNLSPSLYWKTNKVPEGFFSSQFPETGYFTLPETGEYTIMISTYRVNPPPDTSFTLSVNEVSGESCEIGLSSTREARQGKGEAGRIEVSATGNCAWKATSISPWISITSGANGTGSGVVTYSVEPMSDATPRVGALIVAGKLVSVAQLPRLAVTVSSASYQVGATSLSLVSIFGSNLATRTEAAVDLPLPTSLGGTTVLIHTPYYYPVPCRLLFVSPNQINMLFPHSTSYFEDAMLEIRSESGVVSHSLVGMTRFFPGLFAANADAKGVAAAQILRVKPDGSQVWQEVYITEPSGRRVAQPIDLGPAEDKVFLILYGTGFRDAMNIPSYDLQVEIGGEKCEIFYAGPQFEFAGLDQINLLLPRSLRGKGEVPIKLTVSGQVANTVTIKFAP